MKTDMAKTLLQTVSGKGLPETTWVAAALVMALVLAAVASGPGFAASITIGAPVPTAQGAVYSPNYSDQLPAAAFGSTPVGSAGSLVVWEDNKDGSTWNWNIYGIFVDSNGNPLPGQQSFAISQLSGYQECPSVAYNAGAKQFLVVWQDGRNAPQSGLYRIYGARVSASSGSVLDSAGFQIGYLSTDSASNASHFSPSVASNGSTWEVAWIMNNGGGFNVLGAQVDSNGNVYTRKSLAATNDTSQYHTIAWNGGNYLVAFDVAVGDSNDIHGCLLDSGGNLSSSIVICSNSANQSGPTVAAGNGAWLVAWDDSRTTPGSVYGACVSGTGVVQPSNGVMISKPSAKSVSPGVGWDGSNFLVAWQDYTNYETWAAHVSSAGVVVDNSPLQIQTSTNAYQPAVVSEPTLGQCLVAWGVASSFGGYSQILGQVVRPSGLYGTQPVIDLSAMEQDYSSACFDGEHVVSVWQDDTINGAPIIYVARMGTDGTSLDSAGVALVQADLNADFQATPAIAWNGQNFLVVWSEYSGAYMNIWGELLNQDLSVIEPPFAISTASGDQSNPAVASNGSTSW